MILKPKWLTKIEAGHRMSKGLIGSWIFNEGGGDLAFDTSGNGNHGVLIGEARFVQGLSGSAILTDGSSGSYVNVDTRLNDLLGTRTVISVIAQVRVPALGLNDGIFFLGNSGSYGVFALAIGNLNVGVYLNGSGLIADGNAIEAGKWCTLAVVCDGTDVTLYRDGIFSSSTAFSASLVFGGTNSCYINTFYNYSYPLAGTTSFVFVYDRALIASEITSLYLDSYQMFKRGG